MEKFEKLTGIAAPMPLVNIDTDMIIPKVFLKTIKRSGLGVNLFDEMRYDENGEEIADFVLNQPAYRNSEILVAGDNFGCGSSREHAPWAIKDFGIRCIIAPSFADIFRSNAFKNGILPIELAASQVETLFQAVQAEEGFALDIDLEDCTVTLPQGDTWSFEVDAFRRDCLLQGLDDIGITLESAAAIRDFEVQHQARFPWLFEDIVL